MEILDVVNENDEVIGSAPRSDIYAQKLAHRIVHVLVFNNLGHLALQQRSHHASYCPAHWGTSAGGHVQSGEDYEDAARRELEEELGVQSPLEFMRKDFYLNPGGPNKFLSTFRTVWSGDLQLNPEEVHHAEFLPLDKVRDMIARDERILPELSFVMKRHFSMYK